MYYGDDSFGMSDLAASEMSQFDPTASMFPGMIKSPVNQAAEIAAGQNSSMFLPGATQQKPSGGGFKITPEHIASVTEAGKEFSKLYLQWMQARNAARQAGQPFVVPPPMPPIQPTPPKSNTKLYVGLGLAALAVGGIAWFASRKKKSSSKESLKVANNSGGWTTIGD